MADETDDRISHFIDKDGLEKDQEVILGILRSVEDQIKKINEVKISLFGNGTISQFVKDVQALSKGYDSLASATKKVEDATLKAQKVQTEKNRTDKEAANIARIKQKADDDAALAAKKRDTEQQRTRKTSAQANLAEKKDQTFGQQPPKEEKPDDSPITALRKQAKQAKEEFESAQLAANKALGGGASESEVDALSKAADAAKAKWVGLQTQIQEVAVASKAALNPPIEKSQYDILIKEIKDAENAYLSLVAQQKAGSDISQGEIDKQKNKWLQLQSRLTEVKLEQEQALNLTPSNSGRDAVVDLINKLQTAIAANEQFKKGLSFGNQIRSGFGLLGSSLQEARAGIKSTEADIVHLFDELKKIAPDTALVVSKVLNVPKGIQQQVATSVTGGSTNTQQQPSSSQASDENGNIGNVENIKTNISAAEQLDHVYAGLQQRLAALQAELQELGAKQFLGIATPQDIVRINQLNGEISTLQTGIGRIDAATGRAGRNQSTYTRQLFSLQQVLRETPSLAYGFSTYISAISNNIPILFDDIKRIRDENELLNKSGQKGESVWKALGKSFFSWQTLLLAGISILAIYADQIKDFIVELFRSEEANRRAYLASQKFANSIKQEAEAVKTIRDLFEKLNEIKNRNNDLALNNLNNELKALQATGAALENQLDLKTKIRSLESSQTKTSTETSSQSISSQIDQLGQTSRTDADRLKFLKEQLDEANKKASQKTEIVAGVGEVTKNTEETQLEKERVKNLQAEFDLRSKIKDIDDQAIRFNELHVARLKQIDEDYQKGRVDENKRNALKMAEDNRFILLENGVAGDKALLQNQLANTKQSQLLNVTNKAIAKNKDATKTDEGKDAKTEADAAKQDADNALALQKQTADAAKKIDDDTAADQIKNNEEEKLASDNLHKRIISNAETEATVIKAKNQDVLNDDRSTLQQRIHAISELERARRISANAEIAEQRRLNKRGEVSDTDLAVAEQKFAAENTSAAISTARQKYEERQRALERLLAAEKQAEDTFIEMSTSSNKAIEESDNATLEDRSKALKRFYDDKKKQLDDDLKRELQAAHFSADEINAFLTVGLFSANGKNKTFQELSAMYQKYVADVKTLSIDSSKDQLSIIQAELRKEESMYSEAVDKISEIYDQLSLDSDKGFFADRQKIENSFIGGEILFKDHTNRLKALDQQQKEEDLRREIKKNEDLEKTAQDHYSKELEDLKEIELKKLQVKLQFAQINLNSIPDDDAHRQERESAQQEVNSLQTAVSSAKAQYDAVVTWGKKILEFKKNKEKAQEELDKTVEEQKQDLEKQTQENLSNLEQAFSALKDAQYEARKQQIQDEMDLIDKRTQKEIDAVNQSVLSEDEKQKRIQAIQDRADAQKAASEARGQALEVQAAKRQKALAVATVLIDAAQKIASALFLGHLYLAKQQYGQAALAYAQVPLITAASALQIAAIQKAPIPKFATGVKDFGGGRAVLGDAYRSELVEEKDGSMWVTKATPTLYYLKKGTTVYPDAQKALETKIVDKVLPEAAKPKIAHQELSDAHLPGSEHLSYLLSAQSHIQQALSLAKAGIDVQVQLPEMDKLNKTMKTGFSTLNKTIKNKPVFENRSPIRDLFLRYGSNYYKHL